MCVLYRFFSFSFFWNKKYKILCQQFDIIKYANLFIKQLFRDWSVLLCVSRKKFRENIKCFFLLLLFSIYWWSIFCMCHEIFIKHIFTQYLLLNNKWSEWKYSTQLRPMTWCNKESNFLLYLIYLFICCEIIRRCLC